LDSGDHWGKEEKRERKDWGLSVHFLKKKERKRSEVRC
jgi:hypothetical protein